MTRSESRKSGQEMLVALRIQRYGHALYMNDSDFFESTTNKGSEQSWRR